VNIRGVAYHVREWGTPGARPLVLLHGARDASATFQFLVDALAGDWHVLAPDWRGHGRSGWTAGSYWQAEFVADLDVLLDALLPGHAVPLAGHSMGGNIASLYAGTRPARVTQLVMLDALGDLLHRTPVKVDEILRLVLDSRNVQAGARSYAAPSDLADRLMRANRRLSQAKAVFLAEAHGRRTADGRYCWPHDPSFKRSLPTMHSVAEWGMVWSHIAAPVLQLMSSDIRPNAPASIPSEAAHRRGFFRTLRYETVADTGHNLHHDAPAAVAEAIEAFVAAEPLRRSA
jgi:pimeloyl-ACP methyl ester carboxylesterase